MKKHTLDLKTFLLPVAVFLMLILSACVDETAPKISTTILPTKTLTTIPTSEPTIVLTVVPTEMALPTLVPTNTVTETAQPIPSKTGPCTLSVTQDVVIYNRPSLDAEIFSTLSPDYPVHPSGWIEGGWWGFDPGIAQAANIGVFRLRWIKEGQGVILDGNCDQVQVYEPVPPGVCFTMPMGETEVYAEPDENADIITIMNVMDYAAVVGTNGQDWALLDLRVGNLGINAQGWVQISTLNLNGKCDDLPIIK